VAVGAEQGFAWASKAFHMHDVADAVAWWRIPEAKFAAGAFEEEMILCIEIVDLQQIVVNILRADLSLHAIEVHCLE
jgi:hypothetical protein